MHSAGHLLELRSIRTCSLEFLIFGCMMQVRYREDLDLVLKGLTFTVKAGEKVGIVGRTGCGKSTLMNTLLRIVDPSAGQILIDGIDITEIALFDLRSRLALVPQVS